MPVIHNLWVENLQVEKGGNFGVYVKAYKESPVQNLKMVNCTINGVKTAMQINYVGNMQLENVKINGQLVSAPAAQK